ISEKSPLSSELQLIHSKILECTKCELHKSRTKAVPGEGPRDARIMFVGEGPGQNEDEQGRPFVGVAGKLLTDLVSSIGLHLSDATLKETNFHDFQLLKQKVENTETLKPSTPKSSEPSGSKQTLKKWA